MLFLTTKLHLGVVLLMSALCLRGVHGVHNGEVTGVQGHNVSLPCIMKETKESTRQVTWQRNTRKKPSNHDFFTFTTAGPWFSNGDYQRFVFTGSLKEHIGSLQIINVTVEDEDLYTCTFILFPSGNIEKKIQLTVIVPPVTSLTQEHLVLGNENVTFATCTAADSKPPAQVKWLTGDLKGVEETISKTSHPNGTTTTVSTLVGVPTQELNHQLVQCVITHVALSKEETLSFNLQVNFPPMSLNISERGSDSLECSSFANPMPNYTWSRSGQPVPESVRVDGPTLTFLSIASDLNDLYFCEASNPYGSKVGQIYVHLKSGPCTVCWVLLTVFVLITAAVAVAILYFRCKHCPRYFKYMLPDQPSSHASPSDHARSTDDRVSTEEMTPMEPEAGRSTEVT